MASKVSTIAKQPSHGILASSIRFPPAQKFTGGAATSPLGPRLAASQSTPALRPKHPVAPRFAPRVRFAPLPPKPAAKTTAHSLPPQTVRPPPPIAQHQTEARSTSTNTEPLRESGDASDPEMGSARDVDASGLPRLPVERSLYERIVRTQDLSGGAEDDAAAARRSYALDWWVDGGMRGGRLHIDDREMLVDDERTTPAPEWGAEQDSDSGAESLTGRHEIRPLYQRPQKHFASDFGENSRAQHLHLKPRGPVPQLQSNMSPMPQQDLSERQVGEIPKQRIYDMNPVFAESKEAIHPKSRKTPLKSAGGPPVQKRVPKPVKMALREEQRVPLHKLRTPAEASIGCSGLCAGPGGPDGDLFFNDPLNLCVKSISFAGKQVRQLFSYTPDDTVRALVLAAGRGPPPGTLLLVVLHQERAEAEQSRNPLFHLSLVSLVKQQAGNGTDRSGRAEARLWTRLGMANIEPQLDKELVSRALNLVIVNAPATAPLALAGRAAGFEELEAEGGVAQLERAGHSVCLSLCGLVGNADLHVVPVEELGVTNAPKRDDRRQHKLVSVGFPVQSLVTGRVDGASVQLVFALESATNVVHAMRAVYDLSTQTPRLDNLYTISIQGDLLLLLDSVLMCALWNAVREISAVAACRVAAARDRCAPLGQLLRETDGVDIAWWCALPDRERDTGRVVVYDLKQNALLIMGLHSPYDAV